MMLLSLLFLIFGAGPVHAAEPKAVSVDNLSLEQKVGQLFIFGFPGKKISPKLERNIRTLKPGAFIIFGRNIESLKQISELNASLQKSALRSSKIPLFLAVDQEGGGVSRIQTSPPLPSAYTIGSTNEPTLAFQAGKVTGEMLQVLGFNMNLAPVLDITDDKLTSFVGSRGFSDSPHKVSSMGVAFAQGLSEVKVLPVAKHFPGHGPIALDSHLMTPVRQISHSDLFSTDLVPFMQFANSDMPSGIMVAHISFPNIDKTETPATYSHKIITNILTEQLKFKGLIMTDDIEMAGASTFKRIEDRAVAAIKAGNDLIMVGWSPHLQIRAVRGVIEAVENGTLPIARINKSVKKILGLKAQLLAGAPSRTLANSIGPKEAFRKIPYGSVFNEIIASFFKNLPGLEASSPAIEKIRVVSTQESFIRSFKRWSHVANIKSSPRFAEHNLGGGTLVVYHVSSLKNFDDLRDLPHSLRKKIIIVSSYPKIQIEDKSSFLDVVQVYSNHPNLGGYAAEAINRAKSNIAAY